MKKGVALIRSTMASPQTPGWVSLVLGLCVFPLGLGSGLVVVQAIGAVTDMARGRPYGDHVWKALTILLLPFVTFLFMTWLAGRFERKPVKRSPRSTPEGVERC